MNASHPANAVFRAVQRIADPLSAVESEARTICPKGAQRGSLFVLYRDPDGFSYQWGDAEVSRDDAARRLAGRI